MPAVYWYFLTLLDVMQVGWKHKAAVAELEARRIEKAKGFYLAKKKLIAVKAAAAAEATA